MLPIPLTNPLLAIAILLLAIANIEADGLLMCIGYLLTLFNTVLFGFMGYALWQASDLLSNLFTYPTLVFKTRLSLTFCSITPNRL